jgi:hypothetical protein
LTRDGSSLQATTRQYAGTGALLRNAPVLKTVGGGRGIGDAHQQFGLDFYNASGKTLAVSCVSYQS